MNTRAHIVSLLLFCLSLCTLYACGRDVAYTPPNVSDPRCGEYSPGESFPDDDGCNTCSCDASGNIACTAIGCISACGDAVCEDNESPETCPEDCKIEPSPCGDVEPNVPFPAGDGCNTCVCDEAGNTSCTAAFCGPFCGDGVCEQPEEDQRTCPEDCAACGDGICSPNEDPRSCPEDCAEEPFCGNGSCDRGEGPRNCPEDCGERPVCGDGVCEGRFEERNCPEDCQPTPATCGNNVCDRGETPQSCIEDCPLQLCEPFTAEEDNGCPDEGQRACLITDDDFDGDGEADAVCLQSGDIEAGDFCPFDGESVLGLCRGDALCVPDQGNGGTCRTICEGFDGTESCPDGEACGYLGGGGQIGYCTPDTTSANAGPLEPCNEPGFWCGDESICIEVDQQGNALCIPLCRLDEGSADCPGDEFLCEAVFESDELGACLPR